jgi:L-ascorbate metabolism protein UlaG (beta-lactamase superfamily)
MSPGGDRLSYVEGLVDHVRRALQGSGVSFEDAARFLQQAPTGSELVELQPGALPSVKVNDHAIDVVHFRQEALGILFLDGRVRDARAMGYLAGGAHTPVISRLVAALSRGIPVDRFIALARRLNMDLTPDAAQELFGGIIEEYQNCGETPPLARPGARETVTWLGHAAAMFQVQATSIWIDPYLRPRMTWSPAEQTTLFSNDFADSQLVANYGPEAEQLPIASLPRANAVLITHQDIDHFDLGTLMMLPEEALIVVPRPKAGRPWDIDLAQVIRRVLGPRRKVIRLGHGRSVRVGPAEITALPFFGEYPNALPHQWNTYLVETGHAAAVFFSDSSVQEEHVRYLTARIRPRRKPVTVFSYVPYEPSASNETSLRWHNEMNRLWPWYIPLWDRFSPSPQCGISLDLLRSLAKQLNLTGYFVYASGSTPAHRVAGEPHCTRVTSLSTEVLNRIKASVAALNIPFAPIQYGVPFPLTSETRSIRRRVAAKRLP